MRKIGIFLFMLSITYVYSQSIPLPPNMCGGATDDASAPLVPGVDGSESLDCGKSSNDYIEYYRHLESYIPDANTAQKTVHINFVIWQNDAGTTNWQNTPAHIQRLEDMIDAQPNSVNAQWYDFNPLPSDPLPGVTHINDKKIRFKLENIFFMQDTQESQSGNVFSKQSKLFAAHPEAKDQMNIHIITYASSGYWGFKTSVNGDPVILTQDDSHNSGYSCDPTCTGTGCPACPVSIACDNGNCYRDWSLMFHLKHELGHGLDLLHTYGTTCCPESCNINALDFLDDVFEVNAPWCTSGPQGNCDICYHTKGNNAHASPNDGETNNLMGNDQDRYLSPKQLGKVHRATSIKSLRKFTSGFSDAPIEVTKNETWDFQMQLYRPLVIKTGNTLTIKCKLYMPQQGYILVENGAKLVIDGGEITKSNPNAGDHWEGIYITGNSNLPQTPGNQGVLEIKNGGKLSHASTAIANYLPGTGGGFYTWGTMGGIIDAQDAIFEDNGRDVELVTYHDGNKPYLAVFDNCQFIRTTDYHRENMLAHITMWDVSGVKITGCTFAHTPSTNFPYGPGAIYTIDATYNVNKNGAGPGCTFTGYADAIRSTYSALATVPNPTTIKAATINNSKHGIYLNSSIGATVANNTINIVTSPDYTPPGSQPGAYGIYMDFSNSFKLYNNTVTGLGTNILDPAVGIVVKDNCGESDKISRNIINNFRWGVSMIGANQNQYDAVYGLTCVCNDFGGTQDNAVDFQKEDGDIAKDQLLAGIGVANNLFSNNPGLAHIDNFGSKFTYHYGSGSGAINGRAEPVPQKVSSLVDLNHVTNFTVDYAEQCSGSAVAPGGELGEIFALEGSLENDRDLRDNLIDNGSTPALEAQIFFADDQTEYQDLYVDMMNMSPYVSIENLLNLIEISEFPELALRNVMVANPHGARENEVWEALVNRQPPLSQQTLNDIEEEQQTFTAMDVLNADISSQQTESHGKSLDLLEFYAEQIAANDDHTTEIKTHLKYRDEAHFRYALIDMYLAEQDFATVQNELDILPIECGLDNFQQLEYNGMIQIYDVLDNYASQSEWGSLEPDDITMLLNIEQTGSGMAVGRARALLKLNQVDIPYIEPMPIDGSMKTNISTAVNRPERPNEAATSFNLYPNPAQKGHTILQWKWFEAGLEEEKALKIYIRDMQGKLINTLTVNDPQSNTKFIPTKGFVPGVYLLTIEQDGKTIDVHRLAIE